jgi:hypothetical protein
MAFWSKPLSLSAKGTARVPVAINQKGIMQFSRWCRYGWVGLLWMLGCVEPFEADLQYRADLLTVEGTLTDLAEPQVIRLRRVVASERNSTNAPLPGAGVTVLVDGQTRVTFTEQTAGDYHAPASFRAEAGRTYQLRLRVPGRGEYQSTVERMPAGRPITRVYDSFDAEAIQARSVGTLVVFEPGHRLYIDTQDPPNERNFYQWTWTLWENQSVCQTCSQGLYYPGRGCVFDASLSDDIVYDYQCDRRCWQIIRSQQINAMADTYYDGRPITARQVAVIPYYNSSGALLEIRQQSLTSGAFQYAKLLADQSQNTGSLADTPPASIFGNVSQVTNPNDKAVGYFTAASVSRERYWMDRRNVPIGTRPIGLLGGRTFSPEPMSGPPIRPPQAPCTPGGILTPVRPEGWRD